MNKIKEKTLQELVSMQDNAIRALEQALKATQLALELIEAARTEQGKTPPMFPLFPAGWPLSVQPTWSQPGVINNGPGIPAGWDNSQTFTIAPTATAPTFPPGGIIYLNGGGGTKLNGEKAEWKQGSKKIQ